jgi:hypothetical protein
MGIISKFVESRRSFLSGMTCDSARGPDFRCASIEKEVNLFFDYNEGVESHEPRYPHRKNWTKLPGPLTERREHKFLAFPFKGSFNTFILFPPFILDESFRKKIPEIQPGSKYYIFTPEILASPH